VATPTPRCGSTHIFRYASRNYWDQLAQDLRPVYTAATDAEATARFEEFAEKSATPYPAIRKLWENAGTSASARSDQDRRLIWPTPAADRSTA
jgi:transposase-like protein